jgi:ubiquinone/menaquinone biosynthesis C-methylase UbiE
MNRVDYDRIAHLYDERTRDHAVDEELLDFLTREGAPPRRRILDIGCGTGKQLSANRTRLPNVVMVGLDRYRNMLRIAKDRCPEVAWVQGDGAVLPVMSDTCDYVTSQFSYPHVRNPHGFITEVFRVLRPGGRFVMTNIDPWSMTGWAIYRYFPEALTLDHQDYLPVDQFVDLMRTTGFSNVSIRHEDRPSWRDHRAFLAFASERHRASQLMAIPDAAYAGGLQRLQQDAAAASDAGDSQFVSEFRVVTIRGDKKPE